jgi:hypothetical protein
MRSFLARHTLGARLNRRAPYIIFLIYLRPARTLLSIALGVVYYARPAAPDCRDDRQAPRGQRRKGIAGGGRRTPAADPRPHQCAPKKHGGTTKKARRMKLASANRISPAIARARPTDWNPSPAGGKDMNDDGKPLPNQPQLQNWRELAEKASKEPDQDRVLDLVRQLNERLEEAEKQSASRPARLRSL